MPRKLICVLGSDYYKDHARLLATQMVNSKTDQRVTLVAIEIPLKDEPKQREPTLFKALLRRRSLVKQTLEPPPYTKALSDLYGFLVEQYQPGDEVIMFAVTGVDGDWEVLREATRVLAQHLEAGTEPPRVAPDADPDGDASQDIFGDRPQEEPTNHMLGKRVDSSLVIVYRALNQVSEINNFLLDEFPRSVRHIFSFNWSDGRENYCSTYRDDTGQITSREVCYHKDIQWHIPSVVNATMGFIRYKPEHTQAWRRNKPSAPRTLTSLPTPLIPECPPPPAIVSPPTPSKSRFSWLKGRSSKSTTRSSSAPTTSTVPRSGTLMSGFITTGRSQSLMSGFSTGPVVSSPASLARGSISDSSSDSTTSRASTSLTQDSSSSTEQPQSSNTSIDSDCPALREAYISLPGMLKHQVWTVPAYGTRTDNYGLPARVIWRSSRE